VTLEELKKGLSPEQVAARRQLNMETIFAHICTLYDQGQVNDIRPYLSLEEETTIITGIKKTTETEKLKPLFDYFKGEIPYYKLRLGLSVYGRLTRA
jgi:ATP-dependent DNA helicase RecQ